MTFSLYAATVPAYRQILGSVSGLLERGETFCGDQGIAPVEEDPKLGRIYHISVSGIQIRLGGKTVATELPHLPVSSDTLRLSCTTL